MSGRRYSGPRDIHSFVWFPHFKCGQQLWLTSDKENMAKVMGYLSCDHFHFVIWDSVILTNFLSSFFALKKWAAMLLRVYGEGNRAMKWGWPLGTDSNCWKISHQESSSLGLIAARELILSIIWVSSEVNPVLVKPPDENWALTICYMAIEK